MRFVKARVGERDISVSQLGFGCARLYGGVEKRRASGLLERAYELGNPPFRHRPVLWAWTIGECCRRRIRGRRRYHRHDQGRHSQTGGRLPPSRPWRTV